MKPYYHLCTKALKNALLCYDEDDFKAVWNCLAICAIVSDINIYCLCIMSNHIHILLCGMEEDVARYWSIFKMKMGRYFLQKYQTNPLRDLPYSLIPVPDRRAFCQEVAYILRNPFKAGICSPLAYRWSSANVYFNPHKEQGIPLKEVKARDRYRILGSRYQLSDNVRITPDGVILAESFIQVASVEKAFGQSSIQFFNLLKQWNLEDVVRASHGEVVPDAYNDSEVYRAILQECKETYGVSDPEQLDARALIRLVRKLRSRFGSSREQLRRVLPVEDDLLDRAL